MRWILNELRVVYKIDILRLRSIFFLFLFNLIPDFYVFRILRNLLLRCAGARVNIFFSYIRKNFYCDIAKSLYFGKGLFINNNVYFEGLGKVFIGDSVQIANNVSFLTTSHKNRLIDEVRNIRIGNNVWIGTNCVILPGSEIGDNLNIAAGSIVRGKLLDGSLWAGNPAKKKR